MISTRMNGYVPDRGVRGLRRFNKEFAGCTDDAIRPKKSERPPRVATPGTRPEASVKPGQRQTLSEFDIPSCCAMRAFTQSQLRTNSPKLTLPSMPLSTDNTNHPLRGNPGHTAVRRGMGQVSFPHFRLVEIMLMRFTKHRRNGTERELLAFL